MMQRPQFYMLKRNSLTSLRITSLESANRSINLETPMKGENVCQVNKETQEKIQYGHNEVEVDKLTQGADQNDALDLGTLVFEESSQQLHPRPAHMEVKLLQSQQQQHTHWTAVQTYVLTQTPCHRSTNSSIPPTKRAGGSHAPSPG